jgi:hypothetical protein
VGVRSPVKCRIGWLSGSTAPCWISLARSSLIGDWLGAPFDPEAFDPADLSR